MADYNTVKANMAKTAKKNQTYGEAGKQLLSQKIVPMGPSPTGTMAPQTKKPLPKSPGEFFRATERPDEPITAGLDMGPGVSAAGAGIPMSLPRDNAVAEIQEILKYFPNDDLYDLVSRYGGI